MAKQSRNWFFQVTATLTQLGSRFKNGDKTQESTFRNLLDSVVMSSETGDKATTTNPGHVNLAQDADVLSGASQPVDKTIVVGPDQQPVLAGTSTTYNDFGGATSTSITNPVTISPSADVSGKRIKYTLSINTSFMNYINTQIAAAIATISIAFASVAELIAKSTTKAMSAANATQVSAQTPTLPGSTDSNYYTNNGLTVATNNPTTPAPYYNYGVGLSTDFRSWLDGKLNGLQNNTAVQLAYVAYDNSAQNTALTGNGSITTPYNSLQRTLAAMMASTITPRPIVVLNSGYNEVFTQTPTGGRLFDYGFTIYLSDGVVVSYNPGGSASSADPTNYLFRATSNNFSIVGNGTFVLFNTGLVDMATYANITPMKMNAYGTGPLFNKQINNKLWLTDSNFYYSNTGTAVPVTSSQVNLLSSTTVSGNLMLENNNLYGYGLNITCNGIATSDFIRGNFFYNTLNSGAYVTIVGTASAGYGVALANNSFDLGLNNLKAGVDVTGALTPTRITTQGDLYNRGITGGRDIYGAASTAIISTFGTISTVTDGTGAVFTAVGRPTFTNGVLIPMTAGSYFSRA